MNRTFPPKHEAPRASEHMSRDVVQACEAILNKNSRSFSMAARFLGATNRHRAAAVYAFCRRVDDAIDLAPNRQEQVRALAQVRADLERCYAASLGSSLHEPELIAFRFVARDRGIPRLYPAELIEGMVMDVRAVRYEHLEDLLLYCHRVAGVVGLMMCHVFGISDDRALARAAHLGIGMQLTNICRDVAEDWTLGRLYLPRAMLRSSGALDLPSEIRGPFPEDPQTLHAVRLVIAELLQKADTFYASADRGLIHLPLRAGLSVRAARLLYHAIGTEIAAQDFDPLRGRAVVPPRRKLWLAAKAMALHLGCLGRLGYDRIALGNRLHVPGATFEYGTSTLPHSGSVASVEPCLP